MPLLDWIGRGEAIQFSDTKTDKIKSVIPQSQHSILATTIAFLFDYLII